MVMTVGPWRLLYLRSTYSYSTSTVLWWGNNRNRMLQVITAESFLKSMVTVLDSSMMERAETGS